MIVCIYASAGTYYTQAESITEVKAAIELGTVLRCYWYASAGVRYLEDFWFSPEDIKMIRSESEDRV